MQFHSLGSTWSYVCSAECSSHGGSSALVSTRQDSVFFIHHSQDGNPLGWGFFGHPHVSPGALGHGMWVFFQFQVPEGKAVSQHTMAAGRSGLPSATASLLHQSHDLWRLHPSFIHLQKHCTLHREGPFTQVLQPHIQWFLGRSRRCIRILWYPGKIWGILFSSFPEEKKNT